MKLTLKTHLVTPVLHLYHQSLLLLSSA